MSGAKYIYSQIEVFMKSIDKVKSILKSSCCYLLTILQTYEPEMLHKISVRQKTIKLWNQKWVLRWNENYETTYLNCFKELNDRSNLYNLENLMLWVKLSLPSVTIFLLDPTWWSIFLFSISAEQPSTSFLGKLNPDMW